MSEIDISLTETICGITLSLSFSISREALMREVQAEQSPSTSPDILFEEIEGLIQAVRSEARILLDQARTKLLICLISSYTKLLNNNEE